MSGTSPASEHQNHTRRSATKAVYPGVEVSFNQVLDESLPMFPRPAFFEGARLNFAENLLVPAAEVDAESPAIISATEITRDTTTWAQLRQRVAEIQSGMKAVGLKEGERVAGYVGNHVDVSSSPSSVTMTTLTKPGNCGNAGGYIDRSRVDGHLT